MSGMTLQEITADDEIGTWDIEPAKCGGVHLQMDGNDLVSVTDVDKESGTALVTVYASSAETAAIVWRGTVNVAAHLKD